MEFTSWIDRDDEPLPVRVIGHFLSCGEFEAHCITDLNGRSVILSPEEWGRILQDIEAQSIEQSEPDYEPDEPDFAEIEYGNDLP